MYYFVFACVHCIRPAVAEGKTYPGAELILTPPATPEPVLIDEGMVSSMLNEYKEILPRLSLRNFMFRRICF